MQFFQIPGQQRIKSALIENVRKGRVSHAQLFLGPQGSGALPLALAYVQYINCTNKSDADSCGNCPSCLKAAKLTHPDVFFTFPFANTKSLKEPVCNDYVEEWRKAVLSNPYLSLNDWMGFQDAENKQPLIPVRESREILRKLSLKAYESEFRTVIIWYPEKMNTEAANALLKVLEEPGEQTLFLLVAENQDHLLATILSRTQLIKIPRLSDQDIVSKLEENGMLTEEAKKIATLADGDYNEALRLTNIGEEEYENYTNFRKWMQICYGLKIRELSDLVEEIAKSGREKQKNLLSYALEIVRSCMLMNYGASDLVRLSGDELVFTRNFSPFINHLNAVEMMEEFNKAYGHIERNANPRITFFDLSLKLFVLIKRAKTS